jgi:signal transduction histidine kinase
MAKGSARKKSGEGTPPVSSARSSSLRDRRGPHSQRLDRRSQPVPSSAEFIAPSAQLQLPEAEGSAPHARVPEAIPAAWLDRLLAAVLDLPLGAGERAIVEAMVDALAAILPDHAIGACFVPDAEAAALLDRDASPHPEPGQQIIVQRLPEGALDAGAGSDPTRIFPWLAHEYVVLLASNDGSTIHVASDEDRLDRDSSPAVHLADRAAGALGRALKHERRLAGTAARREARALQERMIQTDKLATFGQIAAGIVHELNNPLTSIVAYSDYLIRKALASASLGKVGATDPLAAGHRLGDPEDVERLRRISESANRMLRFTRDLVSYARPSSGVVGPVVLHTVIDQAIAFCEHVLAASSMRLERHYGVDVLAVRGVSEHLVQVFVNLFTNASQAAPKNGGCLTVGTSLDAASRRVRVTVEDNGTGIAPEHLAQVFVPFFTTKGDRHGTGLGLSIVKRIVESHNGEIGVESEPGKGTRFLVELPAWSRG